MATATKKVNVTATAKALKATGITEAKKARAWLMLEHEIEGKDATAIIQKAGLASSRSVGFAASFYAELKEGEMSDERFASLIDAGSKNVQNHRSHYDAIRKLANDIHAQKG